MRLLADLGNTRLKLAGFDGTRLQRLASFTHGDADYPARLIAWLDACALPQELWLASVAGPTRTAEATALFKRAGLDVRAVATRGEALGLKVAYPRFEQLGVDRWLALLAMHAEHKAPCVVVSVGSALTCDGLAPGGRHLGGVIAPAPEAMRAALLARAPGLNGGSGQVSMFALNTADGIESGCVLAGAALIENAVNALSARLGGPVGLVVSGGAADALRPFLPPHEFRPELVLEGLALWSQSHTRTPV